MNGLFMFGLLKLISHMLFIFLSFWALKAVRIEKWIRKNHIPEARILYVFLSIALGYLVSSFFLDFLEVSRNLSLLITN
ncbi:DUF1146 family protein [Jeotgalibaca ciconiae]|uniref:DUF1146 domain-containing protein n=1 Tax=Jeotgalibaca ciconiae TaxID=2496265 RepID=A0A3Q9BKC2_9LACT|nr:DUF1146 family protein [Jeotgalibaca ciconiae]AZP03249.1 DUF1146 domain-containing protein [Jeotgalibaca ciconiae]HJB24622.1 DUF1146 family protein [Candidatus Jeotgalibaca pullicola]